jgi:hypothetical protein
MGFDYRTDDVLKPCRTKLHVEFRANGPHFSGWYVLDGEKWRKVVVSKGRKSISEALFCQMAREINLTKEDFKRLLDCPLKEDEYIAIQREFKRTGRLSAKNQR